ncbi:ankyrin repeat-containing domain protein [Coniochaeta sp. 2T2.1]|nr:ankyrin repeat-containing domain protein [Coniochaeta sp. 2T2.1]
MGDWELFIFLRQLGAKMTADVGLERPLWLAIQLLQPDAMSFLLGHGARLSSEEIDRKIGVLVDSWSPQIQALGQTEHPKRVGPVLECLLSFGLDVNAADRRGRTLFNIRYRADIVRLLLSAGADPNAEDSEGWFPIHYATRQRGGEAVGDLVRAGADVHAMTADCTHAQDITALHLAAMSGPLPAVRVLLDAGADPDVGVLGLRDFNYSSTWALDLIGAMEGLAIRD